MPPQIPQPSKTSVSSRSSHRSDQSRDSQSTAPTSIHHSPRPSEKFSAQGRQFSYDAELTPSNSSPRSSIDTYASTVASLQELFEEPEEVDDEYDLPEYKQETLESNVRPSNAQDFAHFFPTTNRLFIRHDDSTWDGNMNLRVDTEVGSRHTKEHVQLFHMRMHDLKKREFSLRRYCRDSGREVCHSGPKYSKPMPERRPGLQRSVSNAFASIRGKPDFKRANSALSAKSLQRKDSGYGSDEEEVDDVASFMSSSSNGKPKDQVQETNVTKLEFSNYAHVDVKCASKKYEFEYWGTNYAWKRTSEKTGQSKSISYHLVGGDSGQVIARIVPELRSPAQVQAEEQAGGWVPPCSMWICDKSILSASTASDVADVIIATGLTALIDDCIKRHFEPKQPKAHTIHIGVPLTPLSMDMEYVGPKAMMEHVFKRRNSGGSTSGHSSTKHSPLRYANTAKAC